MVLIVLDSVSLGEYFKLVMVLLVGFKGCHVFI